MNGSETPGRPYAPVRRRMLAFLLDYIFIACYLALLSGAGLLARPVMVSLFTHGVWTAELAGFLMLTLPVALYFGLSEGSGSHATWGKRKMGIRVARADGRPLGFGVSLLRSAVKFAPWELAHFTIWRLVLPSGSPAYAVNALLILVYVLVLAYLISPFLNKRRQSLYDAAAGTVVCLNRESDSRLLRQ
ncbi:RDD family protein [Paenibacillus humicola]|uniref:RDD family protein n=1 Tax=Paenibacillus humicola TaxID=3110540 RepID=UPI00237AF94B|nr:RDD family protein [Paenibacillus humicola]